MPARGDPNKLLRLLRQYVQLLAECDRAGLILGTVNDQERHCDACDAPVGVERIPDQEADRDETEFRGCDVGVWRLEDQLPGRMLKGMSRQPRAAACQATRCSRVDFVGMRWDRYHSLSRATVPSDYIALTMFSVTFLASPSNIMVLSR